LADLVGERPLLKTHTTADFICLPFPLDCNVAINTGRTAACLWYS